MRTIPRSGGSCLKVLDRIVHDRFMDCRKNGRGKQKEVWFQLANVRAVSRGRKKSCGLSDLPFEFLICGWPEKQRGSPLPWPTTLAAPWSVSPTSVVIFVYKKAPGSERRNSGVWGNDRPGRNFKFPCYLSDLITSLFDFFILSFPERRSSHLFRRDTPAWARRTPPMTKDEIFPSAFRELTEALRRFLT